MRGEAGRPEEQTWRRTNSAPSDLVAVVYEPSLCVVAQGAKEVLFAAETYRLDPAQSLLVSVDLPVDARVVEAPPGTPLALWIDRRMPEVKH